MDVQRREDRFLDYLLELQKGRAEVTAELRFLALKHPDIKTELKVLEEKVNQTPPVPVH